MSFNHPVFGLRGALGASLGLALLSLSGEAALAQQQHTLPLVKSADAAQKGFLRIINRSDRSGTVRIHAIDDTGELFGPATLTLGARATRHFNSGDLEQGNSRKGLSGGVGNGEGDWRLQLTTDLDIEPLAYIRTSDGFVTAVHDIVPAEHVGTPGVDDYLQYRVSFFNDAGNDRQRSLLRVINLTGIDNEVTINALDDDGVESGGEVRFTLGAYEARTISAQELEGGADDLVGSLGSGGGKWQLTVSTRFASEEERRIARPIQVMSLLFSTGTGNLANLSTTGAGSSSNLGGPGIDWLWGSEGDDILNPGDNDDSYDSTYGSRGNDTIVYSDSGPSAYQSLGYHGLANGISATINGVTNRGTVDKGASGFDTIVDIANPLNAAREAPYGAFGMGGTNFDDSFDLTLEGNQWMEVRGEGGDDRFNIRSGRVRINYRHTPGGIDIDLEAGTASDGYGGADTISGRVWELQGGLGDDVIRGSNLGEQLDGGPGDDMLMPRTNDYRTGDDKIFGSSGDDTIDFSDATVGGFFWIFYDPNWRSPAFSEGIVATIDSVSNRATVDKGSAGTDTIIDISRPMSLSDGGVGLEGTNHDDVFNFMFGEGHWIQVRGEAGNDTFNVTSTHYRTGRLDYSSSPAGIDIDLAAGRASNDGHGDVDTINGEFWEVRGSDHADMIRGTGDDESFIGRGGDDTIDGRGGFDQVRYDRSPYGSIDVDLGRGTVTGTWEGEAFSHRLLNIEKIRGSNHDDTLEGSALDDRLEGRRGDDRIEGGAGNDRLEGDEGEDTFVFGRGHGEDRIHDFTDGDDIIIFLGLDLTSKDEVLDNAHAFDEGVGVWIDLRPFGGGTLSVSGISRERFDASDFLF